MTDGQRTLSYDLTAWAFGTARVGQSYLFKNGGEFYEARVTYFDKLKSLAFTPIGTFLPQKTLRRRCTVWSEARRSNAALAVTPQRQI